MLKEELNAINKIGPVQSVLVLGNAFLRSCSISISYSLGLEILLSVQFVSNIFY